MEKKNAPSKELPCVLAVDDDPVNLRIVRSLLERNGYTVRTAPNGEEALASLQETVPVMLICDVMMPGMSGYDLCRAIKTNQHLQKIPVVFLTGQDSPKDFKTGHEVGAVFYLAKPIKPARLLNVVRMLCPPRRAQAD